MRIVMNKKHLHIYWLLLIILLFYPQPTHAEGLANSENERIIIGFKETIDLTILEDIPHELHHIFESIEAISVTVPSLYRSEIWQHETVKWVETDHVVKAEGQVVTWGNQKVIDINARELNITGEGVKIGVLDTGISQRHADIHVAAGVSFVESSTSYDDDNGHGTHVAGIIAAQNNDFGVIGVAPEAGLYAIKVLDQAGEGRQTDVIAGIEWAIEQDLDILNMSFTSPMSSTALQMAIENATEHEVTIVAASGNLENESRQSSEDIMYPARYPEVIGVGAVDENLKMSLFSYSGQSLSLVAPGEKIYSTYIGEEGYAVMSGTSMASPYVTGVLALYKEVYPELDGQALEEILLRDVIDLGQAGRDKLYGYGFIQAPNRMFWDIKEDAWYTESVHHLAKENYIGGYPNGSFKPDDYISRGEAVTMIGNVLGLNGEKKETIFNDVDQAYFASGYIAAATNEGIISGYPDNTFRPRVNITRGEVAVVVQSAFQFPSANGNTFHDVAPKKFYYDAVSALSAADIISGYPNDRYSPDQFMSRAEFSRVLSQILKEIEIDRK